MLRDQRRDGRMHAPQHGRHVHVIAQAAGAELGEESFVSAGEGEGYEFQLGQRIGMLFGRTTGILRGV